MHHAPRPLRRVVIFLVSVAALALPAAAAERPRLRVDDYQIHAELQPKTHRLIAHTRVKFTALEDISVATFELHNALRRQNVTTEMVVYPRAPHGPNEPRQQLDIMQRHIDWFARFLGAGAR